MKEPLSLEQRVTLLERRLRNLQVSCVVLVVLVGLVAVLPFLQLRQMRASLFTDSLTIPSHFWAAPSFFNVASDTEATSVTLSRLSSNEQVRIESGTAGTSMTFWDARSKKRLALGVSSTGEPFFLSFDRSGNPVPSSLSLSSAPNPR